MFILICDWSSLTTPQVSLFYSIFLLPSYRWLVRGYLPRTIIADWLLDTLFFWFFFFSKKKKKRGNELKGPLFLRLSFNKKNFANLWSQNCKSLFIISFFTKKKLLAYLQNHRVVDSNNGRNTETRGSELTWNKATKKYGNR